MLGRPLLAGFCGTFAIAFSAIFVRLAHVDPSVAAFFRCFYALPVLGLLAARERSGFGPRSLEERRIAWAAGIFLAADLVLWDYSIDAVGAGLATVLGNTQVVFLGLLAWLFPGRTLLGASGPTIGVASLTVLIALNRGFQETLVGTLLGNAISIEVRGVDFLSVVLIIVLEGLSAADVLYINLKQRQAELAALRTFGWSDRNLTYVIAAEGAGLGLLGSAVGAVAGAVGVSFVRGIALDSVVSGALLATSIGAGLDSCFNDFTSCPPLLRSATSWRLSCPKMCPSTRLPGLGSFLRRLGLRTGSHPCHQSCREDSSSASRWREHW